MVDSAVWLQENRKRWLQGPADFPYQNCFEQLSYYFLHDFFFNFLIPLFELRIVDKSQVSSPSFSWSRNSRIKA